MSGMFKPKRNGEKATSWKQVSSQVALRRKHESKGFFGQTLDTLKSSLDQSSDTGSEQIDYGWTLEWYVIWYVLWNVEQNSLSALRRGRGGQRPSSPKYASDANSHMIMRICVETGTIKRLVAERSGPRRLARCRVDGGPCTTKSSTAISRTWPAFTREIKARSGAQSLNGSGNGRRIASNACDQIPGRIQRLQPQQALQQVVP